MIRKVLLSISVLSAMLVSPVVAMAQGYRESTIDLNMPHGGRGVSLSVGETQSFRLPARLFVHKVMLQVDSTGGHSGAEVVVNGDRKGNIYLSPQDPNWVVTVAEETASIQVTAIPAITSPQGRFNIRAVRAVVSDTDFNGGFDRPRFPGDNDLSRPDRSCNLPGCDRLQFPLYYRTVMGNVSNRAIQLVDRLADYTNYRDYGTYLLPIKKAASHARSVAEARGDASFYARPYYVKLLAELDLAEAYINDTFERNAAFAWATELLTLREHIRDILD